jgi:hypothetical protein
MHLGKIGSKKFGGNPANSLAGIVSEQDAQIKRA